jgi:hypothetical protein
MSLRLITELTEEVKYSIVEDKETGKKHFHIEGIWMQGGIPNRNKRFYPSELLEREVSRYDRDYVQKGRAWGELGHPAGPQINPERISHRIISLVKEGNNFRGKAIVTDTPYGKIVEGLINSGGVLGVSTRGMGSLKEGKDGVNVVQDDYFLACGGDVVTDPSAPDAFVQGIMEGKEWVWNNGLLIEQTISQMKNEIVKAPTREIEAVALKIFESFVNRLAKAK